jgi:hypothetical protein
MYNLKEWVRRLEKLSELEFSILFPSGLLPYAL